MLSDLPVRAALLTHHFETGFLVGYERYVEGARPDVAWAHLAFAAGPGYADRMAAALPELSPVIDAYRKHEGIAVQLAKLDDSRPVRVEPDAVTAPTVRRELGPAGDLWAPAKSTSPAPMRPLPTWAIAEAAQDRQVRGYLAWRNYIDASWACELGFIERARARFAELEQLVPGDERFQELQKTCPR
jgi:hypothetical protein